MRFNEFLNEGADERKRNALWAQITDYEKRAKATKNDIKKNHLLKMADELRAKLPVNEGEVVAFPKKHRGDISNMHSCPKCGGDTQGGKYQGHQVQVCIPCKQVYLPPNSGIDQQGNKIKEQGLGEEKVRLDPKCWTGKKIGNPKTKVKGGVRVNNCVPAESVKEGTDKNKLRDLEDKYDELDYDGNSESDREQMQFIQQQIRDLKKKQGVTEAAKGILHRVRYQYDDPSGSGIASGHITLHAPDKTAAARYAASDLSKKGKKNVKVLAVTPQQQGVAEGFFGNKVYYVSSENGETEAGSKEEAQALVAKLKKAGILASVKVRKVKEGVAEDFNAEYDDEAGMAQGSLHTLKNAVEGLQQVIDSGDNLPEWCQEKISLAEDYLVTVWDYLQSEKAQGIDPELNEEFDLIESIVDRIAAQNGVDAEMIWEDLESLSHDELYAFAVTSQLNEDWSKANKSDRTDGMSQKAVNAYRRENPGSKLKTAVTTKPSKLKKGSKASKRRKSYCSRSKGQMNMHNISCAKTPDKAICKARRRWNC